MKKLKYKILFISSILILVLTSCGSWFIGSNPQSDAYAVFDHLAEDLSNRYAMFEEKKVAWSQTSKEYRSRINKNMEEDSLFNLLNEYLGELKDGHVNVKTNKNYGRNWDWKLDYPTNFNYNIIERNYLGKNHWKTHVFDNTILEDSIGYVYYKSFGNAINKSSLKQLMMRMQDTKGLIFDIRHNGGGLLENCRTLARYFADTTTNCMEFYYKSGPGAADFDGPFPFEIKPVDTFNYHKPVIVLTNRSSYSAATFFPAMMSAFPNVVLMGDSTGGGGGIPTAFELPNGWIYRFSATKTIDCKGRKIEFGIPPDIEVQLNPQDEAKGIDTIIERAKEEINKLTGQ